MPKKTFFNLPKEKRDALLDIAINEFASHPYRTASISKIVAKANIAKGSLYQYFENKKDLYLYLIKCFIDEKLRFFEQIQPPRKDLGLFAFLRWVLESQAKFHVSNPLLAQVVMRAMHEEEAIRSEASEIIKGQSIDFFRDLIQKGKEEGEITHDLDVEVGSYIVNTLFMDFGRWLSERLDGIDSKDVFESKRGRQAFSALISILENGMKARS